MSTYFATLTTAGAAKLANALALGTTVKFTHMAVGDGNGAAVTPNPAMTALVKERRRAAINTLFVDPLSASQMVAEQVIPEDVGDWWIREIGLFDDAGTLMAVANCPDTYKPLLTSGAGRTQVIRMVFVVSNTAAVELKIDPAVVLATRKYVDDVMAAHKLSREHPDASETAKGFARMATDAEALAGAAVIAAITPPQLIAAKSAAIKDAHRHAVESASGGRNTVLYDAQGNANIMVILPRLRYEDLGMTASMGTGTLTAFDVGSGSIKSEIFLGAHKASGAGAVSQAGKDPANTITFDAALAACSAKGAGWHMMTRHEEMAATLWLMANSGEAALVGNTDWGRSHAKNWMVGDRGDNLSPGDTSGVGRTMTGSMGPLSTHDGTPFGLHDWIGNVFEWVDGLKMVEGRLSVSTYNRQPEAQWVLQAAYLDASIATGGTVILSHTITNKLGAAGDNNNIGNSASIAWKSMTKSASYVSNQLLKRLLIEPSAVLPNGLIFMRNYGERITSRGGSFYHGAYAGPAAMYLSDSRASSSNNIGFRPAFA